MITSPDNTRLAKIIGITKTPHMEKRHKEYNLAVFIFNFWLSGKSSLPPTWRSLYQVLEELGLLELSQRIQEYLICECTMC